MAIKGRERKSAYSAQYREVNKEKIDAYMMGCTGIELRAYLEAKFKPGMTWQNYGYRGWHLDHIRPISSFQFLKADGEIDEIEIRRAMHFTNLQPLWQWENASKSDNFTAITS